MRKNKIFALAIVGLMIMISFSILINSSYSNTSINNVSSYSSTSNTTLTEHILNLSDQPISYQNVTLPNFSEYELLSKGLANNSAVGGEKFIAPLITRYEPSGILGAYYINLSNDLVFYNYFTEKVSIIEQNVPVYFFDDHNEAVGYFQYYQDSNGTLQYIYWAGTTSSNNTYHIAIYDLFNNKFYTIKTIFKYNVSLIYQFDIIDSQGYYSYLNGANDTLFILSLSGSIYSYSMLNFDMPDGNSPEYFNGKNQIEESQTTNGYNYFYIIQFNTSTHTFANTTLSFSATGPDNNNNPIYEAQLSNGTLLAYALSKEDVSAPDGWYYYEFNSMYIYNNISKDSVGVNYYFNSIIDSEMQSNQPIISQSLYIQQGGYDFPNGFASATYQIFPFINFFNQYYYLSSTSSYFNNIVEDYNAQQWEQDYGIYEIASYNGWLNVMHPTTEISSGQTSQSFEIYWNTAKTTLSNTTTLYNITVKEKGLPTGTNFTYDLGGITHTVNTN